MDKVQRARKLSAVLGSKSVRQLASLSDRDLVASVIGEKRVKKIEKRKRGDPEQTFKGLLHRWDAVIQ